jgi:NADPH2:quinone reductase
MVRAVRLDRYGGVDVLYIADVEMPTAVPGEVVVKVWAAGINPGEASIREGHMDSTFPATFPSGQGTDLAGVISAVGDGVSEFSVGDEVLGWSDRRSSQADYVAVPTDHVIIKPAEMPWPVAGGLFVVGVTAFAAVRAVGAGPGDTVVVSAAAGGVGTVAVQLLKVRGANVIGISSEANHAWLEAHGVTPVGYGDGLADRLREAAPAGIDAFIDLFGAEYVRLAAELGVEGDRINTAVAIDAAREVGGKSDGMSTASSADVLGKVATLVASGQIEIPIAATYPLDQVQAAYIELARRHTRGKIVLIP